MLLDAFLILRLACVIALFLQGPFFVLSEGLHLSSHNLLLEVQL